MPHNSYVRRDMNHPRRGRSYADEDDEGYNYDDEEDYDEDDDGYGMRGGRRASAAAAATEGGGCACCQLMGKNSRWGKGYHFLLMEGMMSIANELLPNH